MIHLDPAFDERNYGCRSFRDFLARLPQRISVASTSGGDIRVALANKTDVHADQVPGGSDRPT